ncbi:hypothetical protein GCM10022247_54840 [Allokutzneria multivorans]|uniref:Polymerase nucleotidyl transferase domain-containing protein n=1 Tax=Allokutzneria multivorans TaxID=1142134 RepID=A0ABP7TAL3_9PSEU
MSIGDIIRVLAVAKQEVRTAYASADLALTCLANTRTHFDGATTGTSDHAPVEISEILVVAQGNLEFAMRTATLLERKIEDFSNKLGPGEMFTDPPPITINAPHGDYRTETPQGFTSRRFKEFARRTRQLVKHFSLPDGELVIQGSRVKRTARTDSDIDIALRVNDEKFFETAERVLDRTRPGTKLRQRRLDRIRHNGQISSFDLGPEFIELRQKLLESEFPHKIQFSVLRIGGRLDTPPYRRIN